MLRVVAAHDALQLRELTHHARQQIGLGEPGRALRQQRVGADQARYFSGEPLHAFDTLKLRAELVVINHFA